MPTETSPTRVVSAAVVLGLMPWLLVGYALYAAHSYLLAFALYHGFCFGAYLVWGQGACRRLSLPTPYLRRLPVYVPVAALVTSLCVPSVRIMAVLVAQGFHKSHLAAFVLYFLLVQPVAEEAFWRGTIYARLKTAISEPQAAALSSLLFGAWHSLVVVLLTPLWFPAVLGVAGFGYLMAWFYRIHDEDVLPVAILHSLAGDLPLMLVMISAVLRT